jgi:N utilization substance protein B
MKMPAAIAPTRRPSKKHELFQHTARALALQVLYEVDITSHIWQRSLRAHADATDASERVVRFAAKIVAGVLGSLDKLDELIKTHAPSFPVDQLAPIDRSILRLALYELLPGTIVPPRVAIDEGVELAKRFGSAGSPRFVNGVLGGALKDLAAMVTTISPD